MTGAIKTSSTDFIVKNVDTGHLTLVGGTAWNKGGAIRLCGMSESGKEGHFELVAHNGTIGRTLLGKPDGSLTWLGNNVVCVSTWRSGDNWYRKYSDGWIEQGGKIARAVTVTVTFHQAYSSVPTILSGCVYNRASTFYAREVYPNTATTTNFTITNTVPAGATTDHIRWYACGY